jgi:membrane-associated phospholipid phosphatase
MPGGGCTPIIRSVVGATFDRGPFARRHGEAVREILLAALAALAYFGVRNLTAGSAATAFANADRLRRFEEATRLDWERSLQAPVLASDALVDLVNWVYIWAHWPVIISVAIVLFRYRRDRYALLRDAILISAGIAFLFFAFFPVAPPRLADPALTDTVTLHSNAYRALQPPGLTDQYAAFPSLHFGWNLLAGIAVWGATKNMALRTLAVIGPVAMATAVVLTANHYVVDVVAGLVVVLIGLAAHRLIAGRARHRDDRGRRPPLAGPVRDSAPQDRRTAPEPVGPLHACMTGGLGRHGAVLLDRDAGRRHFRQHPRWPRRARPDLSARCDPPPYEPRCAAHLLLAPAGRDWTAVECSASPSVLPHTAKSAYGPMH